MQEAGFHPESFLRPLSNKFAADSHRRELHSLYFRLEDLSLFQPIVSDQNLAKFRGLIKSSNAFTPITIGNHPVHGNFIYDGYHRAYAARIEGYTHILGTMGAGFRLYGPLVSYEQMQILPHAEVEKIIRENISADSAFKDADLSGKNED